MTSAKRLRKSICNAIVSASTKNTGSSNNGSGDIDSALDNIFALYFEEKDDVSTSDHDDENDEHVTPLMMACDKCCSEALSYLQTQIRASNNHEDDNCFSSPQAIPLEHLVQAWGHPAEASSCGNTAAHHAMAVGFSFGLDVLENIWGCFEEKDELQNADDDRPHHHRYISLLSQTNQNGDTPLMMACVSGHASVIEHILQHSLKLGLGGTNPGNVDDSSGEKIRQSLADVFSMRNTEECTAMNLACGHGHVEIVRFVVEPQRVKIRWNNDSFDVSILGKDDDKRSDEKNKNTHTTNIFCDLKRLVNTTYSDVDFCKKSVENIAAGLKFMKQRNQQDKIEEFDDQLKQANECLVVLQMESERIAAVTANELLMLDGDEKTKQGESIAKPAISNITPKSKGKSKKKKKQKRNNAKQKQALQVPASNDTEKRASKNVAGDEAPADNGTSRKIWTTVKDEPEKEHNRDLPSSPFITLHDGSVVSKSQKPEYSPSIESNHSSLDDDILSSKPIISCGVVAKPKTLQSILESTTSAIIPSSPAVYGDMAAVMESLCLDPSMLLLSPHGMAMEMSPCQLDAIESILNHQLNATKEARKIQSRLLDK